MQVILLERVEKLGEMGEVVNVKPGYARNFLLVQDKALRATKENLAYFDAQKAKLEQENAKKRENAEKLAKKVDGITVTLIRQASESGQLFGSVNARDIAAIANEKLGENTINRRQVIIEDNHKTLGLFPIRIQLHPEVIVSITVNIARTQEEAEVQLERGEALVVEEGGPDLAEQAIERIEEAEAEAESETAEETDESDEAEKATA